MKEGGLTIKSALQRWSTPRHCLLLLSAASLRHRYWGRCTLALHNGKLTAGVQAWSIVLHDESSDAILEGFVEFAQSSDHEIDEVVDIGIWFLFVIDGLDILICVFLSYAEKIVDRIVHDLHHFLRDELFLYKRGSTSPSSMWGLSYKNNTQIWN